MTLDWEEGFFLGLRHIWRKVRHREPTNTKQRDHIAWLEPLLPRLQCLAQIVAGKNLILRQAERGGGVADNVILLPEHIGMAPAYASNVGIYILRTMIAAEFLGHQKAIFSNHAMVQRALTLQAHSRATQRLQKALPQFGNAFQQAIGWELAQRPDMQQFSEAEIAFEKLRIQLLTNTQQGPPLVPESFERFRNSSQPSPGLILWSERLHPRDRALAETAEQELQTQQPAAADKEKQAFIRDFVRRTQLEQEEAIEPLPMHTFEKTETLDNYKGGARKVDGADELTDHLEALQEVDLREVTRGGAKAQSIFKADIDLETAVGDIHHVHQGERSVAYPEWDFKNRRYRQAWTYVFPTPVKSGNASAALANIQQHRSLIGQLTRRLWQHRNREQRLSRQPWGNTLDLDSVIDAIATRKAGKDPGEKLYATRRPALRDFATTVLFDVSLSSGSWIADRKVLDAIRQAVLVLGEVTHRLGDMLQIQCFASHTRQHCRVWDIKSWHQSWPSVRGKVFGLDPQGYTRIGPAIRHAHANLRKVPRRHKLLLLLTDGKPTDYDRYEGRYGIEDVKMAVKEGRRDGLETFALAFDPKSAPSLMQMFGRGHWQLLQQMDQLATHITTAYSRLTG